MAEMYATKGKNARQLMLLGVLITIASAMAFLWGVSYTSNLSNAAYAGLSSLVGQTDTTFQLALWSRNLGAVGFIIGVLMSFIGLMKRA